MKSINKHILDYKIEELTKKIIDKNPKSKYFFKAVYKKKIYNKVYKNYEGIGSKDSKYILLEEAYKTISNLNKKIEKYFFLKLNNNVQIYSSNIINPIITFIPFVVDNQFIEIYIRFSNDIFDKQKIKKLIEGMFHVIGEEGIYIKFKNKEYLFII